MTNALRFPKRSLACAVLLLAALPLVATPAAAASDIVCIELCRVPTQTTTTPSATDVGVGDSVWDHANVSAINEVGNVSETAHVDFYICDVNVVPCDSGGTLLGSVLVVDGSADSPAFVPKEPGTYCFRGEYSGDREYAPSSDASREECFTVHESVPFFPTTGALVLGSVGAIGIVGAVALTTRRRG